MEYQRCIVHVVRNTLKYVEDKDKKAFANDLKTIDNYFDALLRGLLQQLSPYRAWANHPFNGWL